MLCKNCSAEIPNNAKTCPNCKTSVSEKKFAVKLPEEAFYDFENTGNTESFEEEKVDNTVEVNTYKKYDDFKISEPSFEHKTTPVKKTNYPSDEKIVKQKSERNNFSVGKIVIADEKKAEKVKSSTNDSKGKRAIIAIVSVCFCIMIALSYTCKHTDIFPSQPNSIKTVAFSELSSGDKASFEAYAGFFSAFVRDGFDSKDATNRKVMLRLEPQNANGLYSAFFGKSDIITDEADPAGRFLKKDGSYCYCKISKDKVNKIIKSLGVAPLISVNHKEYYLFDDYYYFDASEANDISGKKYEVSVTSSRRIEDGNYYITCLLSDKNSSKNDSDEAIRLYCIASLDKTDELSNWTLIKLSDKELFAQDGTQIQNEQSEVLNYSIKTKVINAKNKKGKLFAKYIVEYPVFEGSTENEQLNLASQSLNTLYSEMIATYEKKAKNGGKNYKRFVEKGGDKNALPNFVQVSCAVTYNRNGYISLVQQTDTYNAPKISSVTTESTEVGSPVFAQSNFEGYTLSLETGDFVKRDDILGKDYVEIQQKLYEEYFKKHNEPNENGEYIFGTDTKSIGQRINESAWSMSEKGIVFYYQNENGFMETVIYPKSSNN